MEDEEFLNRVRNAFAEELSTGTLRLASHKYEPDRSAYATAVLEAPEFLLMIVRELCFHYIDIAHRDSPNEWPRLQKAIPAAHGRSTADYYHPKGDEIEIEAAADLFRQHRDVLARAYATDWRRTSKRI